jgi:hypothetical protein
MATRPPRSVFLMADSIALPRDGEAIAAGRALSREVELPSRDEKVVTPWPLVRANARAAAVAVATCLAILLTVELTVFRSGFFVAHEGFSSPDFPAAKLALATRFPDARVLFVGDSTVMTGVMPTVVARSCGCGDGFNAGFGAASPWLTAAMTRRLMTTLHPDLIVIGISPWFLASGARFSGGPYATELLTPAEIVGLGEQLDPSTVVDAAIGDVWSAYGDRVLLKEWLASLAPGQRYDPAQRGFYTVPGSLLAPSQLASAAAVMDPDPAGTPVPDGPGAQALGELIRELRSSGTQVVLMVPPFHPAAGQLTGAYLPRAEAALRSFAAAERAEVLDCRSVVAPDDFRDLYHLNAVGAEKYSHCIGAALAARS